MIEGVAVGDEEQLEFDAEQEFDEVESHIDEAVTTIMADASQHVTEERVIKLKTGEQLFATVLCNQHHEPIIKNYKGINFINLASPAILKTIYITNQQYGNVQTQHMFEEWISSVDEIGVPVDVSTIHCILTPVNEVLNNYRMFTTKNRMYKINPKIARHVFELPFIDSRENYDVEMDEIDDEDFSSYDEEDQSSY